MLGEGASRWLTEAAATGVARIRRKMNQAVELAHVLGAERVDTALAVAAQAGRFDDGDLVSILDHLTDANTETSNVVAINETHSAQPKERLRRAIHRLACKPAQFSDARCKSLQLLVENDAHGLRLEPHFIRWLIQYVLDSGTERGPGPALDAAGLQPVDSDHLRPAPRRRRARVRHFKNKSDGCIRVALRP